MRISNTPRIYWIFLAALFLRVGWGIVTPALPESDFAWYDQVARNLASGLGYSDSMGVPTAYRPPAYPIFLAGIYRISAGSLLAARLANALLGALAVLLTYHLCLQIFSKRTAVWAAALHAFTPSLILFSGLLASENVAIPLLLASLIFALRGLERNHAGWLVASGVLIGWTSLARSIFVLLPVTWLIWAFIQKIAPRRIAAATLWLAVGMVAALLPWTARNFVVFGRFIPLSSNSGGMLLYNFNPAFQGRGLLGSQIPGLAELHAQGLDESELDVASRSLAFEFIRENPLRVLQMAPLKLFYLYRDDVSGVSWADRNPQQPLPAIVRMGLKLVAQAYYMALMLLALIALFSFRKLPRDGRWIYVLLPILYQTFFHTLFFGDDRYHLPILPLLAIFAGFQATDYWDQFTRRRYPDG